MIVLYCLIITLYIMDLYWFYEAC